jgi:hypothetical protein
LERQPGKLGIGHGLGHHDQGADDAGDQVAAEDERGDGEPGKKRKQADEASCLIMGDPLEDEGL